MPVLNKNFTIVTRYIRSLRGGSQPILAEASDGLLYVVKFTNNLQGPNLSFNESIGTELFRTCGLQVPSWKPLLVLDSFLDHNPNCWTQSLEGRIRPESYMCFGSRFLGSESRLFEILPGTSFKRVRNLKSFWLAWFIDICARHSDNRQAIFLEDGKGGLQASFVDHGHLFGGPSGENTPSLMACRYLDPRIYQSVSSSHLLDLQRIAGALDVDRLWRRIQTLPDDWKTKSALEGFAQCLCRLSNPRLLQDIVDNMVDAQERVNECEEDRSHFGRKSPPEFLRFGVQATIPQRRLGADRAAHLACASEYGR